jgi:hypothetical protein
MIFSGLRRAALYPLWTAQLITSTKAFAGHGMIGSDRLNRWGLHTTRVALAHRVAAARRRRLARLVRPEDIRAFERDGFVMRQDFLPAAQFAALREQVATNRHLGREKDEGDSRIRKIRVNAEVLAAMPALRALIESPDWRGLLRYVGALDADAGVYVQTIFRHAVDGPADPQTQLHADTFHPTMKAWLFLADVAADAGPFTYVPGSHRLTAARLEWEKEASLRAARAPEEDMREGSFRIDPSTLTELGLPLPRALSVPANTLIVADTFGFHARGASLRPSRRIEIWAMGKRCPFLPWPTVDAALSAVGVNMRRNTYKPRDDTAAFDPI